MIYLYAIADAVGSEPTLNGLADQPVLSRRLGDICAFFGQLTGQSIAPTADNVWRHEQMIEQLMRDRALLPVRFGTSFPSVETLDEILESNTEALHTGLERVRGKVELGVRVLWNAPPVIMEISAASGAEYMRRRAEEARRREDQKRGAGELAESVHQPLSMLACDSTRRDCEDPQFVLTSAYLVDRDQMPAFRDRVNALSRGMSGIRILCTGPWPPYHFVPRLQRLEACHA